MKYGYLAFDGFENELLSEIKYRTQKKVVQKDRLFLLDEDLDLIWAQIILRNLQIVHFTSINDAAKKLRAEKKTWASYSFQLHRRTELIQEAVFKIRNKKFNFLDKIPPADFGFFCLWSEKEILQCTATHNQLPLGKIEFNEDKVNPPSRAYLKLWETFMLHVKPPSAKEVVVDMGSCPGGWTWVLQGLGCEVISVDKAPLDQKVAKLPRIEFVKRDAFKLKPSDIRDINWFFSDIICDPKDLLEMVQHWMKEKPNLKFVCTIKYKGKTDFKTTDEFLKIPGSRVIHLCHNKHEVTWVKL
jgi:23S rRNA (cytidine2498-2'-O)-methyltransferase